jgi:hypothetical protein
MTTAKSGANCKARAKIEVSIGPTGSGRQSEPGSPLADWRDAARRSGRGRHGMDAKRPKAEMRMPSPGAAPLRKLNLNLLYPLDAILRARSLTEAGREVRLSQPAMSHALRRLREHFADDLVAHLGAEQQLTPLGLALRPEVQRVMREVEGAFNFSLAFDPMTSTGAINVATSEAIEQMLLGEVLRNLSTIAPGLTVSISPLDIARPQRALEDGADLLLLPGECALDGLETLPILNDQAPA